MPEGSAPARLGRGLAALLGEAQAAPERAASGLMDLPVAAIRPNPDQPRRRIDGAALDALTASVAATGIVQPIVVRQTAPGAFEIIAGERRWRAARAAGLARVPALVRAADERERLELGLIENLVRENLNPLEVARAIAILLEDFDQTQAALAERLGRSRPALTNTLRLLELPEDVQTLVATGTLTEGHGRAILMADGAASQRRIAEAAVTGDLSVRATERLARGETARGHPGSTRVAPAGNDDAIDAFYGTFGAPVRVRHSRDGAITVELRFADGAALDAALARLSDMFSGRPGRG